MKKQLVSILGAMALASGMTLANADEPITLSLDQMDQVTAGGYGFVIFDYDIHTHTNINTHVNVDINKLVTAQIYVVNHLADAQAGANCSAYIGCIAETFTATDVAGHTSTSVSTSTSAGTNWLP